MNDAPKGFRERPRQRQITKEPEYTDIKLKTNTVRQLKEYSLWSGDTFDELVNTLMDYVEGKREAIGKKSPVA